MNLNSKILKRLYEIDEPYSFLDVLRLYLDVSFFHKFIAKVIGFIAFLGAVCSIIGISIADIYADIKYRSLIISLLLAFIIIFIIYIIAYPSIQFLKDYLKIKRETIKDNKNCFVFNYHCYGLYKELENVRYVLKDNGSMYVENKTTIVPTTENLYSIEERCRSSQFNSRDVNFSINTSGASRTKISSSLIVNGISEKIWKIKFVPSVEKNSPFTIILKEELPNNSFSMTKESLPVHLKYEYVSHQIRYPTKLLNMELVFPERLLPTDYEPDVWFGDGGLSNSNELARILNKNDTTAIFEDESTDNNRTLLRLKIEFPILGLMYVIHWNNP